MSVVVDVCLRLSVDGLGEQGTRNVKFTWPLSGLEEHAAAAMGAERALSACWRGEPLECSVVGHDAHPFGFHSHPGHKSRAVRSLAQRAVAVSYPLRRQHGSEFDRAAKTPADGSITLHVLGPNVCHEGRATAGEAGRCTSPRWKGWASVDRTCRSFFGPPHFCGTTKTGFH